MFDRLAEQTNAQPVLLDGFRLYESGDEAVVVLKRSRNTQLRDIHYSLNQALIKEFGPTPADFDGEDYKFHLTVAIGRYQAELKEQLLADITATSFRERTVATRLAMFVYKESQEANPLSGTREYGTYKILPLRV